MGILSAITITNMKQYFGYIRVSTEKQGQHGVSLQEQKDAILRYAQRSGVAICEWFEERVTAAKQGRPVFTKMMKLLQAGKAHGVVLHKIDRGARNLKDWASIAELTDHGIDVHLAIDGLDIKSRGGRLSADIQAVIAADYIRNLREETLKGFYGRLKQGFYPLQAPIGYANNGGGKAKTLHPVKAPLVRKLFELYATGKYSYADLVPIMANIGLTSTSGKKIRKQDISRILNNSFYFGLIHIKKTGESFRGIHEPLVPKHTFDAVQAMLHGKIRTSSIRHDFVFRRILRCTGCSHALIGELQVGRVYYRCQNRNCSMTCVREDAIDIVVSKIIKAITLDQVDADILISRAKELQATSQDREKEMRTSLELTLAKIKDRFGRLTDAMIDGVIDRDSYQDRKNSLLAEQLQTENDIAMLADKIREMPDRVICFLEFLKDLEVQYKMASPLEKREILKKMLSNFSADKKYVGISLLSPYAAIAKLQTVSNGGPSRNVPRIWEAIISAVQKPSSDSFSKIIITSIP